MKITKELLNTIYNRAVQYCIAKRNDGEPSEIYLRENGEFMAIWNKYFRGAYTDEETFTYENLTEDLDEVSRLRKEQEEATRIQYEKNMEEIRLKNLKQKEEEEKQKYLQLKAKYEGNS